MPFPFNITNPGIYITGLLTSEEAGLVTDLANLDYAEGDILYYDGSQLFNLPIGSEGELLRVATGIPSWSTMTISELSDVTKSATEPVGPSVGDLWIDIS